MRGEPWFKPRRYGYGAAPKNGKGWAAMAVYVFMVAALSIPMIRQPQMEPAQAALWMLLVLFVTGAFVLLAKAKTEGQWRWRWGN